MESRAVRVAVAVLDWGLGHATRSVRIVRALRDAGAEVVIASSGSALELLREACPDAPVIRLPGYDVRYPTGMMVPDLLLQAPRILGVMAAERRIARSLARQGRIDAIVSDSRFAFVSPVVPSILVGNQFSIQSDRAWQRIPANAILGRWVRSFHTVWVVDEPERTLTGPLTDPVPGPAFRPVGVVSRLTPGPSDEPPVRLLVLLSGPEPGRSRLERRLAPCLDPTLGRTVLVRGTDRPAPSADHPAGVEIVDFAGPGRLGPLISAAGVVLCRPGFGTLSDLYRLGAPAVLVPTPGQTEQIVLARRQVALGRGVLLEQRDVRPSSVETAIAEAMRLSRPAPVREGNLLDDAARGLVAGLRGRSQGPTS